MLCFQWAQSFCSFRYAVAVVFGLSVILFMALIRFCPIAAIASWVCVLAGPNSQAQCRPKRRFIVQRHSSIQKRPFEISLLKRLWRRWSGWQVRLTQRNTANVPHQPFSAQKRKYPDTLLARTATLRAKVAKLITVISHPNFPVDEQNVFVG
jgi:hypothetical protein